MRTSKAKKYWFGALPIKKEKRPKTLSVLQVASDLRRFAIEKQRKIVDGDGDIVGFLHKRADFRLDVARGTFAFAC